MGRYFIKRVSADSGDWEGLYINDELEMEGHSISAEDLLTLFAEMFDFHYESREVKMDPYEFSSLPRIYSDLDDKS